MFQTRVFRSFYSKGRKPPPEIPSFRSKGRKTHAVTFPGKAESLCFFLPIIKSIPTIPKMR